MKAAVPFSPSNNFLGRPWLATLGLGLGLLATTPALAQTPTIYGLGTLSQAIKPNTNPLYPAGAPAGGQGILPIDAVTGRPTVFPILVTGVTAGQTLVGMDYRPNTGTLYALGYDPNIAFDAMQQVFNARLYVLDPTTAIATAVGTTGISLDLGTNVTRVGFDFNPTVDRIRVEGSSTRANYRLNPNTGGIAAFDSPPLLTYTAPNSTYAPVIGSVAYTNSYAGSTSTALYALDIPGMGASDLEAIAPNSGLLSFQSPPNSGVLTNTKAVTLDGNQFGSPVAANVDVYYDPASGTNKGYLIYVKARAADGTSSSDFYDFDVSTGVATNKRNILPASLDTPFDIRDIAAVIAPPTQPALIGQLLYAVASGNLISFDSGAPGTVRSAVNFGGGITAGETVVGMDFRPATGQPYALGYNVALSTNNATVYAVNLTTGALTAAGPAITLALGASTDRVGFDFNPIVDHIRVVATNGNNYRLDPNDGSLVAKDGNLMAGAQVSAAAYTNSISVINATSLYDYDAVAGQLYLQNPPNDGPLVAFGSATGPTSTDGANFDILSFPNLTNAGFLAVAPGGSPTTPSFDNLYTVTLPDGSFTNNTSRDGTIVLVGRIGLGSNITSLAVFIANGSRLTWNGSAGTNWATAANWTPNRVPTYDTDVIIPAGAPNQPVVSGKQAVRYVTIDSGATLTANDGSLLTLGGNLNNSGTLVSLGTSNVQLGGQVLQYVGGTGTTAFQRLEVNTAPASLAGPITVHRELLVHHDFATNGNALTLLSDAQGTALVLNQGGPVTGPVTVQRYIDGSRNNGAGYRHYASPVQASTVADLATSGFAPVVNPAYNSAAIPSQVRPFPTVFGFDEARINTSGNPTPQDFDKGFFSPGALSDALTPGQGYAVNIPTSETVDFVGMLNDGDIARTGLTRGGQTESGWQLLGNPYPSPISWTTTYNNGAVGLDNAVYVVKSTAQYAGGYASYVNGTSTNGGTDQIATGQGFFVRVAAAGTPGALTFKNSGRLTTYASPAFQRGDATTAPLVRLALRNAAGRADEAVVYFDAAATTGFDAALDAYKLAPAGAPMVLATTGAGTLSIDARPALGTADVLVPLSVQAEAGSYTLAAAELLRLPTGTKAFLHDAITGSAVDLAQQPSYPFAVVAGASATGRFSLLLTTQGVLATAPAALSKQVNVFPNPTHGTVSVGLPASLSRQTIDATLVNALGQTVLRATLPAGATSQLALPGVARGVYTLRLFTAESTVNKRLIVE